MAISGCIANDDDGSMRMRPSQSSVMNPKVGSTRSLITREFEAVALRNARPIMHAGAAERIDAHAYARGADRLHVDDISEILDVRADEVVLVGRSGAARACPAAIRLTPVVAAINALARVSIQRVASVSAGPPLVELYLKPPLSGGLCDGVITMPSARPRVRPRL